MSHFPHQLKDGAVDFFGTSKLFVETPREINGHRRPASENYNPHNALHFSALLWGRGEVTLLEALPQPFAVVQDDGAQRFRERYGEQQRRQ